MLGGTARSAAALLAVLALGPSRPLAISIRHGSGLRGAAPDPAATNRSGQRGERPRYRLFCFAWVHITDKPRDHWEQTNLPWFYQQIKECDGWELFSDKPWWSDPITVLPGKEGSWGHNMVQLTQCWDHLFQTVKDLAEYDYVVNLEADHIIRVPQVREMIHHHLGMIEHGMATSMQPTHPRGAMMLEWGNVDLFNRAMVAEMRRQWKDLSRMLPRNATSEGCPAWKVGLPGWPLCVQDVDYQLMARRVMVPPVPTYGAVRCNRPICSSSGMEDVDCKEGKMFVPCVSLNMQDADALLALEEIGRRNTSVNPAVLTHASGQQWSKCYDENPWVHRLDLRYTPFYHSVHSMQVYTKFRSSLNAVELYPA